MISRLLMLAIFPCRHCAEVIINAVKANEWCNDKGQNPSKKTGRCSSTVRNVCVCAPQRIRSTVDEKEQKQLLMDLDVVMRSSDCPYIVQFYGALFREVWHTHTDLARSFLSAACGLSLSSVIDVAFHLLSS